jgi:YD repeat-containing protein
VTCEPDPNSPTYGGTIQARPLSHNARGHLSILAAPAPGAATVSDTLAGSESYNHAISIPGLLGRNGLDLSPTLYYSSRTWTVDKVNNRATFNADRDWPSYGFRLGFGYLEGPFSNGLTNSYLLTEPDGSKRELRFKSGTIYESIDSSYIDFNSAGINKVLRRKDGTQWEYLQVGTGTLYRPVKIKDTNGNFITISYRDGTGFDTQSINTITDTLGRQITFVYDETTDPQKKFLTSITGPAPGGGTKTYAAFSWNPSYTLTYSFAAPLTVVDSPNNNSTHRVLIGCTLFPDGSGNGLSYSFQYGGWGIVTRIEQKSTSGQVRSYVEYSYPAGTAPQSDHPAFTTQTVFDGVNTANWTHAVTKTGGLVSSFAITDAAGTQTTTNLYTSGWQTGLVSSVTIRNGSNTYRTISNDWAQDGYSLNPRLTRVTTTLNDITPNQQSKVEFLYTANGNAWQVSEFDYGFLLRRRTVSAYLTDANYTNRHILDRPSQVLLYDGSGNLKARTDFAYDSTSLTPVTGAAQHDDAGYGPGFMYRANLTAITRYSNAAAGSGAVTRQFFYDSVGNLRKAQLDCCQEREWIFTSATQYAYPETIKTGPPGPSQLSVSRTYQFATGLVGSATDENNKTTSFVYDSMNRLTQITRPDGVNLTHMYDDAAAQPASSSTTPINATDSVTQVTITDGLGRVIQQKTTSAAGTIYSATDTQYDALGRPTAVSNPYAPGETLVWTQNTYDPLGRLLTGTPPGGAGSYTYSYAGNQVTATDPAGKQRRTYTDALGRLVQVHEPGYAGAASGSGWVTINGSEQVTNTCPEDP